MTGKTHMAISAAAVAILLAAVEGYGRNASGGVPYPHALEHDVFATVGLVLVGTLAGLFPDLDVPDSELQQMPRRAAKRLAGAIGAGMPRRSAGAKLAQELARLVALPLALLVAAVGVVVRAFTTHRGFTHTLWGATSFTGLSAGTTLLLTGSAGSALSVGAVWLLGYSSHLAADACTPSGIPFFGAALGERSRQGERLPHAGLSPRAGRRCGRSIHLLPTTMRVRTGSLTDTLFIRWISWALFAGAAVRLLVGPS